MTQEQINQAALQLYAALGELYVKRKQSQQTTTQYTKKINQLESELIKLSQTQVTQEQPK
jgi:hypothetical protein